MTNAHLDSAVRAAAFRFLQDETTLRGEQVLPKTLLDRGFEFQGTRVSLMGPQGIFKPAILGEVPLSITTVPVVEGKKRPYEDEIGPDGLIRYRYRGHDPGHRDNVGLRRAMERQVPLIYFHGVVPGLYLAEWPAFIVGDDPANLTFTVAVDDRQIGALTEPQVVDRVAEARRAYVTALTLRRLHQESFRLRVPGGGGRADARARAPGLPGHSAGRAPPRAPAAESGVPGGALRDVQKGGVRGAHLQIRFAGGSVT